MGKKISKNNLEKKNQQLNSLITVLKPKVYITHSSSFKSLVQELTGNGSTPVSSPSPSPSPSPSTSPTSPTSSPPPPNINHVIDSEISMGAISDTSLDSSFEPSGNSYEQMFMEGTATSVEYMLKNQEETDLITGYQDFDLESCLLNMDPAAAYSSYDVVSAQLQQEVSIYDYELSGLI